MNEEPIKKIFTSSNYEEEYYICPKCGCELKWGEQIIEAMYDDLIQAGVAEVDYLYCPDCGWDNEEESCDEACESLGGMFWY